MEIRKLGKYEIVSKIGEGAMGEVYKAIDSVLGREVAIKTMAAAVMSDLELRQRFRREAQSAARLNHPNIITVHDFGEEQGHVYIAMELLEGEDLKDIIVGRKPLSFEEKLSLMEQMAEGLAFAHARDVVHRDLKPANIHILRGGQVKIMDFGLARLSTSNMTQVGAVLGTPHYMSPEQVRGERANACSDVFSLGAVFYELIAYRRPFDADSLHGVLFQVMQAEPEPLARAFPGLPGALYEVVGKALAKDPAHRYRDGTELRDGLRSVRAAMPPGPSTSSSGAASEETLVPGRVQATMPRAVATARPSVTPPPPAPAAPGPSAAAAVAPEATRLMSVEETVAPAPRRTLSGRAATHVPATSLPGAEPAPEAARPVRPASPAVLLAGAAGALALAVGGYFVLRPSPETGRPPVTVPPATLAPSPVAASAPPVTTVPADPGPALAQARRSLEEKDYRAAAARAESVLAQDPGNATALRIVDDARAAVRRGEAAARDVRAALEANDADRAQAAFARLVGLDPRSPDVAALTLRVSEAMSRKAAAAQRALEQARAQPPPTLPPTLAPASAAPPPTLPPTPAPATPPPATLAPAPPASLTPAQVEAARKTIRSVLEEYRAALETRNAEYLRRLAPGLDYEAMKSTFAAVAGMSVKVEVENVVVSGDTATASCLVTYTPTPKPVGKIRPVPTVFRLRRLGAVWIIEDVARK